MRWLQIAEDLIDWAEPYYATIEARAIPDADGDHALVCHAIQATLAVGSYEELVRARGWRDESELQSIEVAKECAERAVRSLTGEQGED